MPETSIESAKDPEYSKLPTLFRFRRNRGKRPRKQRREKGPGVEPNVGASATVCRLLPPGTFSEYLDMFHAKNPGARVSLKLFLSVRGKHFPHLAIRAASRHATCTTCIKHKAILRRLSTNRRAKDLQMKEYMSHLARQYSDRTLYWRSRSLSRLKVAGGTLTMITDAMDESKYRYPRSRFMATKEPPDIVGDRSGGTRSRDRCGAFRALHEERLLPQC